MFLDLHLYKLFPATGENCGKSFSQGIGFRGHSQDGTDLAIQMKYDS